MALLSVKADVCGMIEYISFRSYSNLIRKKPQEFCGFIIINQQNSDNANLKKNLVSALARLDQY